MGRAHDLDTPEAERSDAANLGSDALVPTQRRPDDLAEEMMDLAIRRLGEMGLALSAVSCLVHGPAQDRTNRIIDDVDDLIRDLRRLGRERR